MKPSGSKSSLVKFFFIIPLLAGSLVQAEPFKDSMGQMGKSMKIIMSDFRKGTATEATLEAAKNLNLGCQNALKNLPPDFANDAEFTGPIRQVCAKAQELVTSLQASDLAKATQLVTEMNQLKEASHDKYRQ